VAHFNHRLRGRSSDADERLVRATAKRLKLPCDVAAADVQKAAAEQGVSIEMAARRLRHEFLARCARKRGARAVALAHHADDQIELFLLRLLRGAGGDGLSGMKACNPSPVDRRIMLVRPLLEFSREEIVAFARESHIRFREDASNASSEFERNWVRFELLPLLRKRQPAVGKNILRAMQIVGVDADFVTKAAADWLKGKPPEGGTSNVSFARLHVAVQRRVVQVQVRALGLEPDFQLVEALRTKPNKAVSIGPDLGLVSNAAGLVWRAETESAGFESGERIVALLGNRQKSGRQTVVVSFAGLRLTWRIFRRAKAFSPKRGVGREFFDADKVGAQLVLRHWQAGDRFQPIGMPSETKLQDWFTNRKVPVARRRQLVLAETERGEVFWVEGERIGEGGKVTPATRRVLELRWKQA
jgi:tRNA(Ile)-lysidine synthase